MRTEPRRISGEGELIELALEQSKRSHPREAKPHAEPHVSVVIGAMTRAMIPALRADQQLLQRAAAHNEIQRRANEAANARALMDAPPVDVDLYE